METIKDDVVVEDYDEDNINAEVNNAEEKNANNNRLGEISDSTMPIDKKKRPSLVGNAAFLFAIVDVALASACSW